MAKEKLYNGVKIGPNEGFVAEDEWRVVMISYHGL